MSWGTVAAPSSQISVSWCSYILVTANMAQIGLHEKVDNRRSGVLVMSLDIFASFWSLTGEVNVA
jgi:hypothetical protein